MDDAGFEVDACALFVFLFVRGCLHGVRRFVRATRLRDGYARREPTRHLA